MEFRGTLLPKTCANLQKIINVRYKNAVGRGPLRNLGLGQISPTAPPPLGGRACKSLLTGRNEYILIKLIHIILNTFVIR
jgi:hypothetical protein